MLSEKDINKIQDRSFLSLSFSHPSLEFLWKEGGGNNTIGIDTNLMITRIQAEPRHYELLREVEREVQRLVYLKLGCRNLTIECPEHELKVVLYHHGNE